MTIYIYFRIIVCLRVPPNFYALSCPQAEAEAHGVDLTDCRPGNRRHLFGELNVSRRCFSNDVEDGICNYPDGISPDIRSIPVHLSQQMDPAIEGINDFVIAGSIDR